MKFAGGALCTIACAGAVVSSASAGVIWTSTNGSNRSASAEFSTSGTNLVVNLKNVGTDVLSPADLLTGVFFDVSGGALSLSRISVVLGTGSAVLFPLSGTGTDPGNVVGGEFAYASGLSGGPGIRNYGISSAGLGLFSPGDRFPGTDLAPPASVDGPNYGITSAVDNPATGNSVVTGGVPIIKSEVVATLGGLPAGFDLTRISNVRFQYGTATDEPNDPGKLVPSPGALAALVIGTAFARRRR